VERVSAVKLAMWTMMVNIVAATIVFAFHTAEHLAPRDGVWAVTVGHDLMGFAPVRDRAQLIGIGPASLRPTPHGSFWIETAALLLFTAVNVVALVALVRARQGPAEA
jgi:hypothetical protein